MGNLQLTPGQNIGLSQRKLRQTLGGQGGQAITAYIPTGGGLSVRLVEINKLKGNFIKNQIKW